MHQKRSILVAEEDAATRAFLADNLTADGYHVLSPTTSRPRSPCSRPSSPTSSSATSTATRSALLDAVRGGRRPRRRGSTPTCR